MSNFKTVGFSLFASLCVTLTTYTASVQADEGERLVAALCDSAKTDDRRTIRKKLDTVNLRLEKIYDDVRCGSEGSLLRVATKAGALDAAKYIATKLNKNDLLRAEDDGISIIQFAEQLVTAGDSSKQAFVDLYNSQS